jgi:glycosyltransferase involved in cell wall biosynthesis
VKFLQVTTARGWSGGTEQCLLLAKYMNQLGYESHILTVPGTELDKRAQKEGIKRLYFSGTGRFSLKQAYALSRILKDYSVVNTHISKAHWLVWSSLLFLRRRPILVYTRRVPYKLSLISRLTKYNFRTDGLIAVSPQIYEYLSSTPFLRGKVRYIPSGVELSRFNPKVHSELRKVLRIPEGTLLLTSVANYSRVKGHHVLFPAFKEFLKRSRVKALLLLVGRDTDGEEATREIEKQGLKGKVIQLGFRKDVPQILKATDIFVFPSLNEGIAGSLLQAMAMEKVVVASKVGGIKSYLKDGVNGIGAEPGSVESLVNALMRALRELGNERMKKRARETAEEFDIKRVAEKTVSFYKELLR